MRNAYFVLVIVALLAAPLFDRAQAPRRGFSIHWSLARPLTFDMEVHF